MTGRVVLIRHNDEPTDDRVVSYFRARNIEPEFRRPFMGQELGPVDGSVAASVVYGGPFNVRETDRHPFLKDEHRWVEACMANDVPLLGISQGAQSIAHVLGADVGPKQGEPHEFGYYRIEPTEAGREILPQPLVVTQFHFHAFAIPDGAERLAGSNAFENQAMRYGASVYGLQFHAEVTRAGFRRWQDRPAAPFSRPGAQARDEQDRLGAEHDQAQHDWFMGFLARLFGAI